MKIEQHEFTEEILLRLTREGLKGAHRVIRTEIVGDGTSLAVKDAIEPIDIDELSAIVGAENAKLIAQASALLREKDAMQARIDELSEELAKAQLNAMAIGKIAADRDREIEAIKAAMPVSN